MATLSPILPTPPPKISTSGTIKVALYSWGNYGFRMAIPEHWSNMMLRQACSMGKISERCCDLLVVTQVVPGSPEPESSPWGRLPMYTPHPPASPKGTAAFYLVTVLWIKGNIHTVQGLLDTGSKLIPGDTQCHCGTCQNKCSGRPGDQ